MTELAGKVALITGGAGAIGSGIARACLEAGMRVALADIDEAALQKASAELEGLGPTKDVMILLLDVREPASWEMAADRVENGIGRVRLLFNNAGVSSSRAVSAGGGIQNLSFEEWRWTLSVNLDGIFLGLKTFVPRFLASGERIHIVNTSSMCGVAPLRADGGLPLSYAASKAGIAHMTAQLRTELDQAGVHNIDLSILYPGLVQSNIFATSYRLSPGSDIAAFDEAEGRRTYHKQGADPILVGRYVLRAMARGDFHIFTHTEWRDNVLAYTEEMRHSIADRADTGYDDPTAALVDLTWAHHWPDSVPSSGRR